MSPAIALRALVAIGLVVPAHSLEANSSNGCCRLKRPRITVGKPRVTYNPPPVVRDLGKVVEKAAQDATNVATTAGKQTVAAAEVAVGQTSRALAKAQQDTWAEATRARIHLVEVGEALDTFVRRRVTDQISSLDENVRRFREGKVADALFHLAYDPITDTEKAAYAATAQSSLVNTVGMAAASAYGPGGTAAYVSWQTYRATGGNVDAALRAGIIAGVTSAATSAVVGATAPAPGTPDKAVFLTGASARKAAVAGALGGLAIAASGGDADAIRDGFLWAGGMVLVQDGYRNYTHAELDASPAKTEPFCMSAVGNECAEVRELVVRGADGQPVKGPDGRELLDYRRLSDKTRSLVGEQWKVDPEWSPKDGPRKITFTQDRSPLMQTIAKVPGANAMGLFHDQWVSQWNMDSWALGSVANKATILPAVVLTYVGTGAPFYSDLKRVNVGAAGEATPAAGKPPRSDSASVASTQSPTSGPGAKMDTMRLRVPLGLPGHIRWRYITVVRAAAASSDTYGGACERLRRTSGDSLTVVDGQTAPTCEFRPVGDSLILPRTLDDSLRTLRPDSMAAPGRAWEWMRPDSGGALQVRLKQGLVRQNGRQVVPAPGWVWSDPNTRTDFSVVYAPIGIARTLDGALVLAPGWEWVNPQDRQDVRRRLRRGLRLTSAGVIAPAPGWDWVTENDPVSLEVRPVAGTTTQPPTR